MGEGTVEVVSIARRTIRNARYPPRNNPPSCTAGAELFLRPAGHERLPDRPGARTNHKRPPQARATPFHKEPVRVPTAPAPVEPLPPCPRCPQPRASALPIRRRLPAQPADSTCKLCSQSMIDRIATPPSLRFPFPHLASVSAPPAFRVELGTDGGGGGGGGGGSPGSS